MEDDEQVRITEEGIAEAVTILYRDGYLASLTPESSTVAGANTWIWDWGMRPASSVVLRGTTQTLEINVATVVATQTATVSVEWTEE
jgi:hypothetical protein